MLPEELGIGLVSARPGGDSARKSATGLYEPLSLCDAGRLRVDVSCAGVQMNDVFVGSLMSSPVHTVNSGTSLRTAGRMMLDHGIGSVIVVNDDDQLEGILTATDFLRVIAEGDPDPDATVGALMSPDVTTTTANESIESVADPMVERGFHHVPVLDEGEVIGVITTTDLTAYLSRREEPSPS